MSKSLFITLAVIIAMATLGVALSVEQRATASMGGEVTGTLSVDGKPFSLRDDQGCCMVALYPMGGGAVASGAVDPNGQFQIFTGGISGAAPGGYLVSVLATKVIKGELRNGYPVSESLLPAMYGNAVESELVCWVKPGENRYDIQLRSDAGPIQGAEVERENDHLGPEQAVEAATPAVYRRSEPHN
jgi:hypothetical protein